MAVASRHQDLANITITKAVVDRFFAMETFAALARTLYASITFAADLVVAVTGNTIATVATTTRFRITVYIWITKLI